MAEDTDQLFAQLLKRGDYSLTRPRQLVFTLLAGGHTPQSMQQLQKRAEGRIDRASLYRTIRIFEQLGIAQRIPVGWKYKLELSDVFTQHHHHLSCLRCGRIIALKEDEMVEKLIQSIAEKHAVVATRHQLEIQGYCVDCR